MPAGLPVEVKELDALAEVRAPDVEVEVQAVVREGPAGDGVVEPVRRVAVRGRMPLCHPVNNLGNKTVAYCRFERELFAVPVKPTGKPPLLQGGSSEGRVSARYDT